MYSQNRFCSYTSSESWFQYASYFMPTVKKHGCLAPRVITFYGLGAKAKGRMGAETKVSFFLSEVAISPGCVSGSPLKAHGGKPHGKSLCCPFSSKRVTHPVSLVGVISRMLSTCYLSLQAWVPTKWWQQNRNQVGVEVCSVIWWMYVCQLLAPAIHRDAMDKVVMNFFVKLLDSVYRIN